MSKRVLPSLTLALIAAAALAACGGQSTAPAEATADSPAMAAVEVLEGLDAHDVVAAYEEVLGDIYTSVLPSVVKVQVQGGAHFQHSRIPGQGSGFVWSGDGHVVTNHHVVDGADRIRVVFADGSEFPAEVIGGDAGSDLAVVKIEPPDEGLQSATLGDSDRLRVGQLSVAVGSPFGQDFSMTCGIISGLERSLRAGTSLFSNPKIIQTDAPINPGNSGGPLLDRLGRVIGINSQIISGSGVSAGVGFAVPINTAKRVIPELISKGVYEHAYIGISGVSLDPVLARANGLPDEVRGVLVLAVAEGGPADEAGISGGDEIRQVDGVGYPAGGAIITAIDGVPIEGMDDLIALMSGNSPGDEVALELLTDAGESAVVSVTLGARPRPASS